MSNDQTGRLSRAGIWCKHERENILLLFAFFFFKAELSSNRKGNGQKWEVIEAQGRLGDNKTFYVQVFRIWWFTVLNYFGIIMYSFLRVIKGREGISRLDSKEEQG